MLDTIYTATTGLQSFAKGLDVISTNTSNVNTVGYKQTQLSYSDIHYNFSLHDERGDTLYGTRIGGGVAADTTSIAFTQGDMVQTGNDTDVAISGRGFFILEKDGGYVYTRDGQFEFNSDGDLVTRTGGYRVMSLAADGSLQPLNENAYRTQPAVPTSTVSFSGNLATGTTTSTTASVQVIDTSGAAHTFTLKLTPTADNATTRTWNVAVTDENNSAVGSGGSISFQSNGSPQDGANTYSFTYTASGGSAQQITFNFGDANSFANVTAFAGTTTSSIAVSTTDGRTQGALLTLSFDSQGRLLATYSNQQTATGPQLALADFENTQALEQLGQSQFRAQDSQRAIIGAAGQSAFGSIKAQNVEGSNVDLTTQFSTMIIIQRGYQASSQVLTAANEMLQQLLEIEKP